MNRRQFFGAAAAGAAMLLPDPMLAEIKAICEPHLNGRTVINYRIERRFWGEWCRAVFIYSMNGDKVAQSNASWTEKEWNNRTWWRERLVMAAQDLREFVELPERLQLVRCRSIYTATT